MITIENFLNMYYSRFSIYPRYDIKLMEYINMNNFNLYSNRLKFYENYFYRPSRQCGLRYLHYYE